MLRTRSSRHMLLVWIGLPTAQTDVRVSLPGLLRPLCVIWHNATIIITGACFTGRITCAHWIGSGRMYEPQPPHTQASPVTTL